MRTAETIKYFDPVWGDFSLDEPVIAELMAAPSLLRLKGVDQGGYSRPFFGPAGHSRFEHSVGVLLLLKKYQASQEEQVAGLIHDVSHSAFSHTIDYVVKEGSESQHSYQDSIFKKYVYSTEIPEILKKHGLSPDYILDEKNFPLLETDLPELCADRIDYSLRGMLAYGIINQEELGLLKDNLIVSQDKWAFKTRPLARFFAESFRVLNRDYYSGLATALMFKTASDYLRHALAAAYISQKDLYKTDKFVLEKINAFLESDGKLREFWRRMNQPDALVEAPDQSGAEITCKSRVVDPLIQESGRLVRFSQVFPEWQKVLDQDSKPKKYYLRYCSEVQDIAG